MAMKTKQRSATLPTVMQSDWQIDAIAAYQYAQASAAKRLRTEFAQRLDGLTGRPVPPEAIYVSRDDTWATLVLDGVLFRMRHREVVVVRPCVECGIGQFESPAIRNVEDLGYALISWTPLHANCEPVDSPYWLYSEG